MPDQTCVRTSSRSRPPGSSLRTGLPASLAIAAALSVLLVGGLSAQDPLPEPLVGVLPMGSRAMALGWAGPLGLPDPGTVLLHPALVASEERGGPAAAGMQLDYTRLTGRATALGAAAVMPWFGGAVGVAVQALDYDGGTLPVFRDLWPGDVATSSVGDGVSEMAASLVVGRRVGPVEVGVTGRIMTQRSGERSRSLEGFDVGVATRAGPVRIALSGRNLGTSGGLPAETVLGVGSGAAEVGPLDVAAAGQLRVREDGEVVTSGGVEVAYWPVQGRTFIARMGLRDTVGTAASPVTFGFGFRGDVLQLDYAFLLPDDDAGLHRITVGWR